MSEERSRPTGPGGSDVIVVGAGIVGLTTAYELAGSGLTVRLIDKGKAAGLQSSRNWGFVRRQGCDPSEIDLVQSAASTWERLAEEIGPDLTLVKKGLVNLARTEPELTKYRTWLDTSSGTEAFGSRMISGEEATELVPWTAGRWAGGLYTPTDGHADPERAGAAVADAARRRGVIIEEQVTVTGLNIISDVVRGVHTSAGSRSADRVVIAAGAWSRKLLAPLGLRLPVRWIRATAARTVPLPRVTELAVHVPQVGFSQQNDGSVIFGSAAWSDYDIAIDTLGDLRLFLPNFARNRKMIRLHLNRVAFQDLRRRLPGGEPDPFDWPRMDNPPANVRKIELAHRHLTELVPDWSNSRIQRSWAGTVDVTPDALPVIERIADIDGLILATGMSSHGFGIGPGVGAAAAALVREQQVAFDLSPYRIGRFKEGAVKAHQHL
ncbi:NAD(P)/FAD-dependent oxidoreductase [Nakamurella lactea]|uniref:NAD(P)/FAD-dependent oxidoreductase n=1 Tax=Nakamurella lactea TaxID=459515 RepID=UPI000410ADC3|nr:FAD-binding oxidoreductase [Nakamurella lactea]